MTLDYKPSDIKCSRCGYISQAMFLSEQQIKDFNRPCPKCHAVMKFEQPTQSFHSIGVDDDE